MVTSMLNVYQWQALGLGPRWLVREPNLFTGLQAALPPLDVAATADVPLLLPSPELDTKPPAPSAELAAHQGLPLRLQAWCEPQRLPPAEASSLMAPVRPLEVVNFFVDPRLQPTHDPLLPAERQLWNQLWAHRPPHWDLRCWEIVLPMTMQAGAACLRSPESWSQALQSLALSDQTVCLFWGADAAEPAALSAVGAALSSEVSVAHAFFPPWSQILREPTQKVQLWRLWCAWQRAL